MKPARGISLFVKALFFSTLIVFVFSCDNTNEKAVNEGVIEYDAKVVDYNHPLAELAPGSATLKFKDDKFMMEMTAMGMFKNMYICNLQNKTLTQMVNFLDMRQASVDSESVILKENEGYKLIIEETSDEKTIAGYKCKRIKVKKVSNPGVTFDAYYTTDMGTENVNELSPYSGVKGMLMQYRLSKMGLEMEFVAKSVKKETIPSKAFEIPGDFKIISKQQMQEFFNQF
ncbi:MAG: hypothetical protein J0L69_03160 [Bacteroidetes bacterium]|nr:hypothetical protein [Bacteroidota bacterium]